MRADGQGEKGATAGLSSSAERESGWKHCWTSQQWHPRARRARRRNRGGFTLLEVILSLAILTSAIAVLGELARIGIRNADYTHKLTMAQMLCETKMAEITSEITLPDPVVGASFEAESSGQSATMFDPDDPTWLYSIESDLIDTDGLLQITVTVYQDLPEEKRPVNCSLVRWMIDSSLTGSEDDFSGDTSGGTM